MEEINYNYFKGLDLRTIKKVVKKIKYDLPKRERETITYSKNFTLSLSNYCVNDCSYCYFNYKLPKTENNKNTILLEDFQIEKLIQEAVRYNCKEALILSGEHPECISEVQNKLIANNYKSYVEYVKSVCIKVLKSNILPHTNIGLLSFEQLNELKKNNASMGLMLESTNMNLCEIGGVHELSPGKEPKKRIKFIENAGKLHIPFTTGLLLGIGENLENRIHDLHLIKSIHQKYGHIQEVIIQNFVQKEAIRYRPKKVLSIKEILKTVGLAKIIFGNEISIQVPPNLITGYEREFIHMGIDDFGGISPLTLDYVNPESKWPQIKKLESICKNNGYILKERLPIYPKYIRKPEFCSETIKKTINNINLDAYN
ncbi:MAG: 7,8-didemethyl-8-hydroxy-5-deazariboflavin synthase subunit CofG [Candidatus Lokiarchaeota archaeon]|nr:7,8-didemethyl-8-hydroxy-5-deazariboflavin synthase subunit CofG [Candidatus Lokiarchaeota archaeon]MBD3342983.1 7,8-didemethyl-8-hydroxy-5-deazariboflavin synthase subunit CofG [Candidatus Lokiarchaeota archaeon]